MSIETYGLVCFTIAAWCSIVIGPCPRWMAVLLLCISIYAAWHT